MRRARGTRSSLCRRFAPIGSGLLAVVAVVTVVAAGGCDRAASPPAPTAERADQTWSAPAPDPEAVEAALAAAGRYLDTDELPKAAAILARLVERAPRDVRARELFGQVLTLQARRAAQGGDEASARATRREAWAQYRVAVELSPDSAGLHHSAGLMASMAGAEEAALDHFRTAAELDPLNPQYPLYAAQVHLARAEEDAAAACLERVLVIDPDEPAAHASLAVIEVRGGRYDAALARIAVARRIAPADVRFRLQEARIHRLRGHPRDGLELLAALPESVRAGDAVTEEIAADSRALDRPVAAAEAWALNYRVRPKDRRAAASAARTGAAWLHAGDGTRARMWLAQAQRHAPDDPEVVALETALDASLETPD